MRGVKVKEKELKMTSVKKGGVHSSTANAV